MGRVARSSTSLALKPGMETSTSTIGTLIWGSSSRGNMMIAAAPSRTEVMMINGVSLESMKARATRPAKPSSRLELGSEAILLLLEELAVNQPLWVIDHHRGPGIEARKNLRLVIHVPASLDEVQPGAPVLDDEEDLHLAALHDRGGRDTHGSVFAHRNHQSGELTRHQPRAGRQLELHAKRTAGRVGDWRDFGQCACEVARGFSHANRHGGVVFYFGGNGFWHIGLELKFGRVFDVHERLAG